MKSASLVFGDYHLYKNRLSDRFIVEIRHNGSAPCMHGCPIIHGGTVLNAWYILSVRSQFRSSGIKTRHNNARGLSTLPKSDQPLFWTLLLDSRGHAGNVQTGKLQSLCGDKSEVYLPFPVSLISVLGST